MWKVTILALLAVAGTHGLKHIGTRGPYDRPILPDTHIVGGSDAARGQFPHQVSMQTATGTQRSHRCGGSILTEKWILTAAHCIVTPPTLPSYLVIVAGDHDLSVAEGSEQERNITKMTKHEMYPDASVVAPYDIALCLLAEGLIFNQSVVPIRLPVAGSIPSGDAILSGWGSIGSFVMPDVLQTAVMPIVPFEQCYVAYDNNTVESSMVCTGPLAGGMSACSGDSGGPLIQYDAGIPTVIGIVSWGTIPCGLPDSPSVYTRVSEYNAWIADHMVE